MIAAELYLLGVGEVYYIDLLGNETLFEPTEENKEQRGLRLLAENEARNYIKRHLGQNAIFMVVLLFYFWLYKRRKKHV